MIDGSASFGVYAANPCSARQTLFDVSALGARVLAHAKCRGLTNATAEQLLSAYFDHDVPRAGSWSARAYTANKEPPDTAALTAVGVGAALNILNAESLSAAADAMRWLAPPCGAGYKPAGFADGLHASPTLTAIHIKTYAPELGPARQLRHRANLAVPTVNHHFEVQPALIVKRMPTMLWPELAIRIQPSGLHKSALPQALSCAVLLAAVKVSMVDATAHFCGTLSGATLPTILGLLRNDIHWAAISVALTRIADYLVDNEVPIDYGRRRQMDYHALLTETSWHQIWESLGRPRVGQQDSAKARAFLFGRISGLPLELAPMRTRAGDSHTFMHNVRNFPARLTPPLAIKLHDEASRFLDEHDIDEPATWHPPLRLLDDLELPNTHPEDIDMRSLHDQVLANRPLGSIARQLHTDPDTVRHLLVQSPTDASTNANRMPTQRKRRSSANQEYLRRVLSPDRLKILHDVEGRTGRSIAQEFGVSYAVLKRLAARYGVDFARRLDRPTADWLFKHYVIGRRSRPDIAAEFGVCTMTVTKWLYEAELQKMPPPSPPTAMSAADAQKLLAPALARRSGGESLRHFVRALNHVNLKTAATELQMDHSTLHLQIRRLEKDFGGRLFLRATTTLPMAPTPLGAQVASAFQKLDPT
jgi:transposase